MQPLNPLADPNERVSQGVAGSGQAFILKNAMHDPLAAGIERARYEQSRKDAAAQQAAKAAEDRKKMEEAAYINPEYGLQEDVKYINQEFDTYHKWLSDQLSRSAAGLGKDPLDLTTEIGKENRLRQNRLLGLTAKTKADKELADKFFQDLNNDPKKYALGTAKAYAAWRAQPLEQRGAFNADAYFDENAFDNAEWTAIKETDATAGHSFTDDGRTLTTTSKEYYDPNRMMTAAADMVNKSPLKAKAVQTRWDALPEDEKDVFLEQLKNVNTDRGLSNGKLKPLTPLEFYTYKTTIEPRMATKVKQSNQQVSEGNYGIGAKTQDADYIVDFAEGMTKGTLAYKPAFGLPSSKGDIPVEIGVTNEMVGMPVGKNLPFVYGNVYYNPETKETFPTIQPATNFDPKNTEHVNMLNAFNSKYMDENGNIDRKKMQNAPWIKSNEFFGKVIYPAIIALPDIEPGSVLMRMKERGIPWTAGKAEIERASETPYWLESVYGGGKSSATPPPSTGESGVTWKTK